MIIALQGVMLVKMFKESEAGRGDLLVSHSWFHHTGLELRDLISNDNFAITWLCYLEILVSQFKSHYPQLFHEDNEYCTGCYEF